jgi:hypothetical protein
MFSARLFEHDPRLAQLAFVDMDTKDHGVSIARLMRDDFAASSIALVSPYATMSDKEIKNVVEVAAAVKNTQPSTTMGRFLPATNTLEKDRPVSSSSSSTDFKMALLRVGHPLDDATFGALSHFKVTDQIASGHHWSKLASALDGHRLGALRQFGDARGLTAAPLDDDTLKEHLDRDDRAIFTFQSPAWRVANANMIKLNTELNALYEEGHILQHSFWRNRMLNQCDDTITLALVIPVTPSK